MPSINVNALIQEDEANSQSIIKPYRFGKDIDVNFSPTTEGKWSILPNGDQIWQLRVKSKDAKTLNFLLTNYHLSPNSKLYFYNDNNDFLGYYTAADNIKHKEVVTWPIDGSSVVVEFYEPQAEIGQSTFQISKVVHGYRTVSNHDVLTKALNSSGNCNVDVNCAAGDDFEIQKNSVALILSGSNSVCSGTLLNNTANDGTPYFLTANHCFGNNTPTWSFRFKWISDAPDCATTVPSGDGPRTYTLSGATLMARNSSTDFMLLRLNNSIPAEWDLTFAGWDRTGTIPENVTGLHHPSGDIMKIAQYYSTPLQTSRYNISGWEIPAWDLGVTEGGSSGSGLFDQNGRIIGQLYGGGAACSDIQTNRSNDNYGRFDVSWESGGFSYNQLKDWLDPLNSNITQLDPFQPVIYENDAKILRLGVDSSCSLTVNPTVTVYNNGTQDLSNFTLKYRYDNEPESEILITEAIAPAQSTIITLPEAELSSGNHNLNVRLVHSLDQNTDNNTKRTPFEILNILNTQKIIFNLVTDNYSEETSWRLLNSANEIIYQSDVLEDNTNYTHEFDQLENDCYRFELLDEYGDGICCSYGAGSFRLSLPDGTILKQGGNFGAADVTSFKIESNLNSIDLSQKEIAVYPNPTDNVVTIKVPNHYGTFSYEIISTIGQVLENGKGNGNKVIHLKTYGKGAYVIKIKTEKGQTITKKVIVK